MSRLGQWWARETSRPGVGGQLISIGGVVAIVGLAVLAGGTGASVGMRVLGAVLAGAGLALIVLAVRRLRR